MQLASFLRLLQCSSVRGALLLYCYIAGTQIAAADTSSRTNLRTAATPEVVLTQRLIGHLPPDGEFTVSSADVDGDGALDILARRQESGIVFAKLSSLGGREFMPFTVVPPTNDVRIHAIRANHDTRADLLVYDRIARTFYLGFSSDTGRINFILLEAEIPKLAYPLLVHDMNGDGLDDILLLEESTGNWQILLLQEDGSFKTAHINDVPFYRPSQVLLGDVDGDGLEDILIFQRSDGHLYLYKQQSDFTFSFSFWGTFGKVAPNANVFLGDFGVVGVNAIYAWSESDGALWQLARGTQGARFRLLLQFPLQRPWNAAFQGDFNGDGRDDVLLSAKQSRFLQLVSAATETATEQLTVGLLQSEIPLVGDFNGDGVTDLVTIRGKEVWLSEGHTTKVLGGSNNLLTGEDEKIQGPYVCAGLPLPTNGSWGRQNVPCPDGYALYDVDDSTKNSFGLQHATVRGTCCRLPADDILTDEHTNAPLHCPPGYIATGSNLEYGFSDEVRCTKINEKRYQLSQPAGGVYWGMGFSLPKSGGTISKNHIPPAIRSAIGRDTRTKWDSDGCIGQPFGALFVGKSGADCSKVFFSELQYKGAPGDPPANSPVQMFPNCSAITSLYAPPSLCLK